LVNRYTHLELKQDIDAPAGYYTPQKEVRLKYNGREVLYVVSQAVVDASCCGVTDFTSALVPGYLVRWHSGKNKEGLPVSEVEPVADKAVRDKIRKIIQETENVSQIEFW
jgi:hypothetical protein